MAWSRHPATRLSPSSQASESTPPLIWMYFSGLKVEMSVRCLLSEPSVCVAKFERESSLSFHSYTDEISASRSSLSVLMKFVEQEAKSSLLSGFRARQLKPLNWSDTCSLVWESTVRLVPAELTSDTLRAGYGYSLQDMRYLLPFRTSLFKYKTSVI